MAFKDLYENAKKQGADTATLKKIDEDARKVTGVGVTDRVVPKVTTTQPVVKVAASQPATSTSVSQPTVEQPSVSSEGTKDAETQNDTQNTEETKKTSKEMAEEAQKAYDDYVKSDEHKKKLEESNQKLMQEQLANQLLAGIAPDLQQPKLAADEKEQQLKAAVDYYKTKAQEEEDEVVMVTDLEELASWSAEDRAALEQYVMNRDQDFYDNINPFVDNTFGANTALGASGIIEKYGKQRVDEIAESLIRSQNKKTTQDVTTMAQEEADKGFWAGAGHSAATVPANLVGGMTGVMGYIQELGQRTGRYKTLDPNNAGNLFNTYSGAVRETVAQNIEGENGENGVAGKIGSLVYQGGMSALDSGARALTGSTGNMILSGMSSFSQTMAEASQKGATPGQAVALAATNAAIEAVSEKLPLDNLLDAAKGGKQTAKQVIGNALKQAGIEATTEEISLIGTTLAEAAILREKSSYNQQIQKALADGKSYVEAKAEAATALLVEAVNTAAVSVISAGISSGGASTYANIVNRGATPEVAQQAPQEAAPMTQQQGDNAPDTTPVQAPQAQQNSESNSNDVLLKTMELMANNGGKLSNKATENILHDPETVSRIIQQTGEDISGTKSEQRSKLKAAMEQLFYNQNSESETRTEVTGTEQQTQAPQPSQQPQTVQPQAQMPQQQTPVQTQAAVQQASAPQADMQMVVSNQSAEGGQLIGTGAAEANFSGKPAYNATLSADNAQTDRRTDVRAMELPQQDVNGGNISATTGNVYGSQNTPDDLAAAMEEPVARGDFSYVRISNDEATQRAQQTIGDAGSWETARDNFRMDVDRGNAGAELSARGALILNHAAEVYQQAKDSGDVQAATRAKQEWLTILSDVQKLGTNTAQGMQALRIIRNLMPQDKIQFTRIAVQNMVRDLGLKNDIQVDEQLLTEYENATTDEQRDEIMERIQQNVADQIPSTMLDKWNALRYTNMLGNLKTIGRNIGGNVGNSLAYRIKDATGAVIEVLANKVTNGKVGRTKSVVVNRELQKACGDFFKGVKNTVGAGGKYNGGTDTQSEFTQGVMDKRRIFKSNSKNDIVRKVSNLMWTPMEVYRKGTNWMMNNEYFGDEAFGKAAFTHAMAGYLQANGVKTDADLQNADPALIDQAMAYAVKEAQETTFHDNSALANVLGKVKNVTSIVGEGIMPFTKTPANVLTRAEEYSPLGILNTAILSAQKAAGKTKLADANGRLGSWATRGQDITGTDIINSLSKTLTGTGIFALGAILQSQGFLTGGPDDDEEKAAFDKENGIQNHALVLPDGRSYTMDWLTPEAMPLFMGAAFMEAASDKNLTFADLEQVFTSIADPMIQMSMMQGINQSLENIKYSDNNLIQFGINAAVSYLTQGLTNTLLGQLERNTEEYRQTTFVDKDSQVPAWMQRQLGSASQKIPGWDYQQMDYVDSFGQKQENVGGLLYNLASPGYAAKTDIDAVDKELYRLNASGVEGNVFPDKPPTTLTWKDTSGTVHKDYNLSAEEYQKFAEIQGQTEKEILDEVINHPSFSGMTDAQKTEIREKVKEYAREQAKRQTLPDYYSEAPSWMAAIKGNPTDEIIRKAVEASFNSAFSGKPDKTKMESAYNTYKSLAPDQRKQFMNEATGETKNYIIAKDAGMSEDAFLRVYGNYENIRDNEKLDKGQKAVEWAHFLNKAEEYGTITGAQKQILRDSINFYHQIKATTGKYDTMVDEGIDSDTAYMMQGLFDGVTGTGKDGTVRDIDTRGAVANSGLHETEIDDVMHAIMPDYDPNAETKQYSELKYDYIRFVLGLSAPEYADTYRAYLDNPNKEADIQAMMDLGFSKEIATALYNVYQSTKKGKAAYLGYYEGQQ